MDRPNRRVSNRYFRHLMQAIEEELGAHSLHRMLRSAGLERYLGALPPADDQARAYASEIAILARVIREYYGQGARGSLTRVGRAAWRCMLAEATFSQRVGLLAARWLPGASRPGRALELLADEIRPQDGQIGVHHSEDGLLLVDESSDQTFGQASEERLCWITVGMIQEALKWATGGDHEVEEVSCRAAGAQSCRFQIQLSQ